MAAANTLGVHRLLCLCWQWHRRPCKGWPGGQRRQLCGREEELQQALRRGQAVMARCASRNAGRVHEGWQWLQQLLGVVHRLAPAHSRRKAPDPTKKVQGVAADDDDTGNQQMYSKMYK